MALMPGRVPGSEEAVVGTLRDSARTWRSRVSVLSRVFRSVVLVSPEDGVSLDVNFSVQKCIFFSVSRAS